MKSFRPFSTEAIPCNTNSSAGNPEYKVYNEVTHHPEIPGSLNGVTRSINVATFCDIRGNKYIVPGATK